MVSRSISCVPFARGDFAFGARMTTNPSLADSTDLSHADLNQNGTIDAADAIRILRASAEDVDGDGVMTSEELSAGASPFLTDSDFDGLSDSAELYPPEGTPATDPGSRDTDGDGLFDAYELTIATDPTETDTDHDGFTDGTDSDPLDRFVFYHGDHLGSTTLLTDLAGNVLSRVVYSPYGEAGVDTGGSLLASVPEFGFTGQRTEEALGLYDYRGRFYDPGLGTFLSADPFVAEPWNPQSFNRYSYVLGDPLGLTDPTGYRSMTIILTFYEPAITPPMKVGGRDYTVTYTRGGGFGQSGKSGAGQAGNSGQEAKSVDKSMVTAQQLDGERGEDRSLRSLHLGSASTRVFQPSESRRPCHTAITSIRFSYTRNLTAYGNR